MKTEIDPTRSASLDVKLRRTGKGSLDAEQMRFYDEEGYLVIPGLLNEDDMKAVKKCLAKRVSEIADDLFAARLITDKHEGDSFELRLALLFRNLSQEDFLKYGRSWRDRLPGYYHLMSNLKILDAVESLIGGEIFSNPVYNTRPKVPGVAAGAVPWHQDKSYWPDANSNPVITVWIPLVDSTLENGCLHIWPRTHRSSLLSYHADQHTGTAYTEIDKEHLADSREVPLPLAAGGAILFNDQCVHMSTPNNAQTVRWSVDLRYQPTDQDAMPQYGAGFLARSRTFPARVATLEDWLAERPENET